jgi:DNA-damage-inducible protein J
MAVKTLLRRVAALEKALAQSKMPKTTTKALVRSKAAKTTTIRARVSPELKSQVEKVLAELGITPSEAMRLFYHQVSKQKGLPFPMRVPNALTRKTLDDAESGKNLTSAEDTDDMFRKLGIKVGESKG